MSWFKGRIPNDPQARYEHVRDTFAMMSEALHPGQADQERQASLQREMATLAEAEKLWDAALELAKDAVVRPAGKYRIWYDPSVKGFRLQTWKVMCHPRSAYTRHASSYSLQEHRRDILKQKPEAWVQWDDLLRATYDPASPAKTWASRKEAEGALKDVLEPVQQQQFYGEDGKPI